MCRSSTGWRSSTSSRSTRRWSPARRWRPRGGSAGRRPTPRSRPAAGGSPGRGAEVAEEERAGQPRIAEFTDAAALSRTPLLREVSEADMAVIRPHTHAVELRRGEHLYQEGDAGDQLYVVIEGKVKLTRTSPDGREVLIRVQGPGEMFGELAMFDPAYRTSTATAVTDSRLAVIAHEDLRGILTDRPAVAL